MHTGYWVPCIYASGDANKLRDALKWWAHCRRSSSIWVLNISYSSVYKNRHLENLQLWNLKSIKNRSTCFSAPNTFTANMNERNSREMNVLMMMAWKWYEFSQKLNLQRFLGLIHILLLGYFFLVDSHPGCCLTILFTDGICNMQRIFKLIYAK